MLSFILFLVAAFRPALAENITVTDPVGAVQCREFNMPEQRIGVNDSFSSLHILVEWRHSSVYCGSVFSVLFQFCHLHWYAYMLGSLGHTTSLRQM